MLLRAAHRLVPVALLLASLPCSAQTTPGSAFNWSANPDQNAAIDPALPVSNGSAARNYMPAIRGVMSGVAQALGSAGQPGGLARLGTDGRLVGPGLNLSGSGSTGDVSGMSVAPGGTSATRLLSDWLGDTKNAAAYVQAGDTSFGQAINRAIVAAGNSGSVKVAPGTYANVGDILIKRVGRGAGGATGRFTLDLTGVVLTGTCKVIVDSSKHLTIQGGDAKACPLSMRGMWNSRIEGTDFDTYDFGDVAGTDFNVNYWNTFDSVGLSTARFNAETNANTFINPRFRGDGQQGWATARAYAFEFNANANVQALRVIGGDVSYYASGIYTIAAANTSADVDLSFSGGTYFDTVVPQPYAGRSNVRVVSGDAFFAQTKALVGASMAAASNADQQGWSGTTETGWRAFAGVNLIGNGDLRHKLASYVGAGRPLFGAGGAAITEGSGAGLYGRFLNINQANTTNNAVFFQVASAPYTARYSASWRVRLAGGAAGTKSLQFQINGQYFTQAVTGDWTLATLSPTAAVTAGQPINLTINTIDGTAFNVDLDYVAVTIGSRPPLYAPSPPPAIQEGSNSFAGASIAAGAVSADIYIGGFSGLVAGDAFLTASYSALPGDCTLFPNVASATQAVVKIYCPVNARSVAAGTMSVRASPKMP